MERTRAWRRGQDERAKARALRQLSDWDLEPSPRNVGFYASTARACSCNLCSGFPRERRRSLRALYRSLDQIDLREA